MARADGAGFRLRGLRARGSPGRRKKERRSLERLPSGGHMGEILLDDEDKTRGQLLDEVRVLRSRLRALVTEQKQAEGLLGVQTQVLERITTDATLTELLEMLVLGIEGQSPGMLCSVLLLDPGQGTLRHGAAPSLPETYRRAIDGAH